MSAAVTPDIAPISVAIPALSIFTKFPAVRPLTDVFAMPYMYPSRTLKPIALIPPRVFGPSSYEIALESDGFDWYSCDPMM